MALFGEKYGHEVRVLKMGDFSTELCGGTHVGRTGDIGVFKIVSEAGVASGVRRIEAVTGAGALAYIAEQERRLGELSHLLSGNGDEVVDKLRQLFDRQKKLERELDALRSKAAGSVTADLASHARAIGGLKVVAARLEGFDAMRCARALTSSSNNWATAWCCSPVRPTVASLWWQECTAKRSVGSRRARWWRISRNRSMARAAGGPTWPRVAASTSPNCPPCWRLCRIGSGSVWSAPRHRESAVDRRRHALRVALALS